MKVTDNNLQLEVRPGTEADIPLLLKFIRSMAEFEKLQVTATETILRESLFGENTVAQTLFAFIDGQPVAYAVYYFTFATMVGKRGLWLDDLFVVPEFRSKGIGKVLMAQLAEIAIQNKCGRFEWIVLDWNQAAIDFYRRLGASVLDNWHICRLAEDKIPGVANHH
jgi:GNAT superfamily N-acetyltransferase